jgi:hypothetical protein
VRRKKVLILAGAAMVIAVPAGWYFGSPWWTLWRMREAARAGDMATVVSYIDAKAIQGELEAEGRARWGSLLTKVHSSNPTARRLLDLARSKLALPSRSRLDPGDARSIQTWLGNMPLRAGGLWWDNEGRGHRPAVVHHGLNEFIVIDPRASVENGPVLTFRRHGFRWKLEAVRFGQQ